MNEFRIILNLVLFATSIGLIVGLYNPVIVLWWCARQNRKMILTYYGSTIAVTFLIHQLFDLTVQ